MIALLTFFLVIVASLTATRVAAVALTLSGVSPQVARFQARSALSGPGFTTSEAESVVNHPVRRRIIMFLMLVGSAGLVTAVATLSISFVGQDTSASTSRLVVLTAGCLVLLVIARSSLVDRAMTRLFARVLSRFTDLELHDYAGLVHLADGHAVMDLGVTEGVGLCSRALGDLELRDEGVAVLEIEQASGIYVGAPRGSTEIRPGDTLVAYGNSDALVELSHRRPGSEGDEMHVEAVSAQRARDAFDEEARGRATPESVGRTRRRHRPNGRVRPLVDPGDAEPGLALAQRRFVARRGSACNGSDSSAGDRPDDLDLPPGVEYAPLDASLEVIADGFEIPRAVEVLGADEYLVSERTGGLHHVDGGEAVELAGIPTSEAVEIDPLVWGGVNDVSLHPDFEANGLVYLAYVDPSFRMVVGRFDFSDRRRPTWPAEEAADGLDGVIATVGGLVKRFSDYSYDVKHVLVDGDIVTIHSHATLRTAHRGDPRIGFNITDRWRVVDGEIVEHWDSVQPIDLFARPHMLVTGGRVRNGNGTC